MHPHADTKSVHLLLELHGHQEMLVLCLWMSEAEETLTTVETSPINEDTVHDQLAQHEVLISLT